MIFALGFDLVAYLEAFFLEQLNFIEVLLVSRFGFRTGSAAQLREWG